MKRSEGATFSQDEMALSITGLSKKYAKSANYAIHDINFDIKQGEIVGLVGHNGAGKSTTLKCLTGMLDFKEGTIKILGSDIKKKPIEAKSYLGFVSDNHAVFQRMTGQEYITFIANLYGVSKEDRLSRIEALNGLFQLGDKINNLISSYSHGMKQKVCMMASLVHEPKVWVLDEPMLGLDPRISNMVLDFMRSYAAKGNTILFSSHNLAVVEEICDRVIVIKNGAVAGDIDLTNRDESFDLGQFFMDEESTYEEFVSKSGAEDEDK